MLPQARYKVLVRALVTSALAFAILISHAIYVLSDPTDDEFYKKSDAIKWFVHWFENTIWKVDYYIIGVDQPGSWFNDIQSTAAQIAIVFGFWWFFILNMLLIIDLLKLKAAILMKK